MLTTRSPIRMGVAAAASVIALATGGCGERDAKPAVATPRGADGSIVYEKEIGADTQLFSARPDGTGERQLTHVDGNAMHPDWSPDGKRIVFHIEHKNAKPMAYCSVAVMNADGSGLTDLANRRRGCDGWPSFTAGGRRIVFVNYDDIKNVESLASMDLAGRDRRDIKTPSTHGRGAPDGLTRRQADHVRWALRGRHAELAVRDAP